MSMVQVIRTPEALDEVAHDWDRALMSRPDSQVFLTSFWLTRWMRAFGNFKENCILLGRNDDGEIILQCALLRTMEHGFLTLRSMGNVHTSRWGVSATTEGYELLHNWVTKKSRASVVRLGRMDCKDAHHALADPMYKIEDVELPLVECRESYQDYVAGRSRNFRKSLRRSLAKQDHIQCIVRNDGHSCVDAVRKVSANTWKFKEGTAIVSSPDTDSFFISLLDPVTKSALVQSRLVLMQDAQSGDESVGFVICLTFKDRLYAIKMGLDERVLDFSPGMGALNAVVEHACADPELALVDLDARGPHGDYKMRWATRVDKVETLLGFGPHILGRTAHALWSAKTKLKSFRDARTGHPNLSGKEL